jgi:GNAT superfamily N-acetyltransferase
MIPVAIREATEADLPDILRAYRESGIGGDEEFSPDEARAQFARLRGYPSYRVFVASAGRAFAGTYALIVLDNLNKRGRKAGVVEDVAVLPEFQGRGVGKAMMEHARRECRAAGCYKLTLSSNLKREDAHRFYDALGFERHGYSFLLELPARP